MSFDDKAFMLNMREWPGEYCCVKNKGQSGILTRSFPDGNVILVEGNIFDPKFTDTAKPQKIHVDELISKGWIVD